MQENKLEQKKRLMEDYDESEEKEQTRGHGHLHKAEDHICSEAKIAAAYVCQVFNCQKN